MRHTKRIHVSNVVLRSHLAKELSKYFKDKELFKGWSTFFSILFYLTCGITAFGLTFYIIKWKNGDFDYLFLGWRIGYFLIILLGGAGFIIIFLFLMKFFYGKELETEYEIQRLQEEIEKEKKKNNKKKDN